MANNANGKLTLKLLIDKKSNKVLFGEASKDFADFVFSLLSLPLGAVTMLLTQHAMVGSIGKVYASLSNLNRTYILSEDAVSNLLYPCLASSSNPNNHFFLPSSKSEDEMFYICNNINYHSRYGSQTQSQCYYVSEVEGATCPTCKNSMNTEALLMKKSDGTVVGTGSEQKGYVKGVVTYSVMDDLRVVPMSTISSITLLNKFQIKDLGLLEEKTVTVGYEEGLMLLKASLQSKTVLTDVFLKKNDASRA